MEEWLEWLTAGVNISLFLAALACLCIAAIYLWRSYRLEEMILDYKKKAKEEVQIPEKQNGMDASGIYQPMIPVELLSLLRAADAGKLSLETQKNVQAVSMSVNSSEFSKMIHEMEAKEVFSFINQFYAMSIPLIYEAGGFVQEFRDAGMSALFLKNYEEALISAVSICDLLNESGRQQYASFSIGLTYENAVVGAVGNEKRMDLLTLSEESFGLSEWLMRNAPKYYAKILVTDAYAKLIPDFQKKFNTRLLGYVYIRDMGSMKRIYDVFDGDEKDVRNRKRQTKIIFEKGVALFVKRDYVQARQCFIEVLKTDRFDRAAKEYVFRCDESIHNDNGVAYIERYG